MRTNWLDILLTLWVVLAAAAFLAPMALGREIVEPELVSRCVYLCVVAAGLFGLAVRVFRSDKQ